MEKRPPLKVCDEKGFLQRTPYAGHYSLQKKAFSDALEKSPLKSNLSGARDQSATKKAPGLFETVCKPPLKGCFIN